MLRSRPRNVVSELLGRNATKVCIADLSQQSGFCRPASGIRSLSSDDSKWLKNMDSRMSQKLRAHETRLVGKWYSTADGIVGNDACDRIDDVTENHIRRLSTDSSGWDTLYIDPDDGRYWELLYPQSEMHAGGLSSEFQKRWRVQSIALNERMKLFPTNRWPCLLSRWRYESSGAGILGVSWTSTEILTQGKLGLVRIFFPVSWDSVMYALQCHVCNIRAPLRSGVLVGDTLLASTLGVSGA